jgi:hypothetical protein
VARRDLGVRRTAEPVDRPHSQGCLEVGEKVRSVSKPKAVRTPRILATSAPRILGPFSRSQWSSELPVGE